jgi:hypothetical protein
MMQTLYHISAECLFAMAALVGLAFLLDWLGLRAWIAWLSRRDGMPKNSASKEYWRVHE